MADIESLVERAVAQRLQELEQRLEECLSSLGQRLQALEHRLSSAGPLSVRDVVRIDGLDNVDHLSLNGKKAQLRSWEGPGGRWVVQVLQTGQLKSLRCENLRPVAASAGHEEARPGAKSAGQPGPDDSSGGLCAGDVVEVQGLRRQSQLNGTRAEVLSWDDAAGRWLVQLTRNKERKQLRTCNLKRVGEAVRVDLGAMGRRSPESPPALEPGSMVKLRNLKSEDLNGLRAHVQRWDSQAQRFIVQLLETREEKSLREENLFEVEGCLRAGQVVTIDGLGQAPHLNGQAAEVLRWDPEKSRWNVRIIDTDETKSLRPEHLTAQAWGQIRPGSRALSVESQGADGRRCSVVRWEGAAGKWIVLMEVEGQVTEERRFRPRQLRLIASSPAAAGGASEEDAAAEVLGDSSDDDDEYDAAGAGSVGDVLREGTIALVSGSGSHFDGQKVRLLDWKDIGGPFGKWEVQHVESGEVLTLSPSCLEAVSSESGRATSK